MTHPQAYPALDWIAETAARGESIVGRIIRERREEAARREAARKARLRLALTITLPIALLAGIGLGELTAYALGI